MAISTFLLFTIIMVSISGTNSQLEIAVVRVPDIIITLLENITDTSTTTSTFLPHLASLLNNQEDLQRLTNIILQNQTDMCAAEDLTSILQEILEDQQVNNNKTTDLMHNYTSTLTGMANAIVHNMKGTQSHMADYLNQSADTQTRINETLNRMASTQSEVAVDLNQSVDVQTHMDGTLIQVVKTLNQSVDTQNHIDNTLDQIANTQRQMANTQTETTHALAQVAVDLNQSSGVQTHIHETLNRMASTSQSQIANDLTQSAGVQTRVEETLIQVVKNLNQSVDTQNRTDNTLDLIANTLTQMVHLLQMQSELLQNMTATTTYMVGQINIQNQLISRHPNDIIDCSDLASRGPFPSGSYTIQSWDNLGSFRVYCDMDTGDGGWTVFQRRFDGSVDFFRGWDAYEDGFGSPDGEYWLGLRQILRLTRQGDWTLRIDLHDFEYNTAFAEYRSFSVGDAADHYRLSIGAYSGTAGDSLHNNQAFSTKDSDHDTYGSVNCAQERQGAWWYHGCGLSNLNGQYLGASQSGWTGMIWYHLKLSWEVVKRSEMKIRRTQ